MTSINQNLKQILSHRIPQEIQNDINAGLIIGASAYVERAGETLYNGSVGKRTLLPSFDSELTDYNLFRMASMTKPVIAVCVMIQVERGKLSLEDEVANYLPQFGEMKVAEFDEKGELTGTHPSPRPITILDLLTHTSGLGSGMWYSTHYPDHELKEGTRLADCMDMFAQSPLEFDPGTAFSYSATAGFDVLARLVEITSGLDIETFLQKNLCEPLGMTDTTFAPSPEQMKRVVTMYASTPKGPLQVNLGDHIFENMPRSYFCGGAGLVSSLKDYVKFVRMLLHEGRIEKMISEPEGWIRLGRGKNNGAEGRILSNPETIRQMRTPWAIDIPGLPSECAWGLSMRVVTGDNGSQKPLQTGAYGWSGAYGTHFWIDPENQVFAVYLSNMSTAGGAGAKTARHFEQDVMEALEQAQQK